MKRKKVKIIVIFGLCLSLMIGLITWLYLYQQKVEVVLVKDLTVPYSSSITNLSFVEKVKKGKILTKEETIDTTKLGTKKITLTFQNQYGRKENQTFEITVVDTNPPEIKFQENLTTIEGNEIDLLKDVMAYDEVDKDVKV